MESLSILSQTATVWAIGLTALIVAVNARGFFRFVLSWLLALGVMALCVVYTILNIDELRQRYLDGMDSTTPQAILSSSSPKPEAVDQVKQIPLQSTPSPSELDELEKNYRKALAPILDEAQRCANSISQFNIGSLAAMSDSDYEREQSRALSLRNQAAAIARKVKSMSTPESFLGPQKDLERASENLRLAGWAVHAYFGAESGSEEQNFQHQFQKYAKDAHASFVAITAELDKRP